MAHITTRTLKDGSKRYFGKVYDSVRGRYVYTHSWPRKKDAILEAEELRRRILMGENPKPKVVLFDEYVASFLETVNQLAESTQEDYTLTCTRLVEHFGDTPIKSITTRDCEVFLAELFAAGYSKYTVRKSLTRLRQIMRRAVRDGIITRSPAEDVTNAPKGELRQKEIVVLDKEQIATFIDLAPEDSKALFMVWFATGLRFGEIAGLQWPAVDWPNSQILVRAQIQDGELLPRLKSKTSRRSIPLSAGVLDVLREHQALCPPSDLDLIFPTPNGRPQHRSNIHRLFVPIAEEMKLSRFTPHCIRHTFATVLLSEGVNPKLVATLMGHSPGSGDLIMSTYGHLLPCDAGRAAKTMGDIVVREDQVSGNVLYPNVARWSKATESATIYGRSSTETEAV